MLPPITLSRRDVARLEAMLADAECEISQGLEEELLRATILTPDKMPADVVTMHSRVRCSDPVSGKTRTLTLCYPGENIAGGVSVLAPVGAALLGLSVGQTIDWPGPNGKTLHLHIDAVEYQPEAAGEA